jgi:glycosidase
VGLPPSRDRRRPTIRAAPRLFSGYHGYWPLTLARVDGRFGSAAALKRLVERAHAKGMTVLLDAVFKHVHEESDLPRAHPDWFGSVKLPDGRDNIRLYDEHPLTTWFDRFLPAFDFGNDACRAHLAGEGAALRRKFDLDGFRLDAVKHIPARFFAELRRALEAVEGRPQYLIGETIADRATIVSYLGADRLDGQFDFPLYHAIIPSLATGSRGMDALAAALDESGRAYPAGAVMSNLLGNHDFPRSPTPTRVVLEGNDGREIAFRHAGRGRLRDRTSALARSSPFPSSRSAVLLSTMATSSMTGAGDPDNRRMPEALAEDGAEEAAALARSAGEPGALQRRRRFRVEGGMAISGPIPTSGSSRPSRGDSRVALLARSRACRAVDSPPRAFPVKAGAPARLSARLSGAAPPAGVDDERRPGLALFDFDARSRGRTRCRLSRHAVGLRASPRHGGAT